MKKNLIPSLLASLFGFGGNAVANNKLPLPYFVGAELYEIHTDAHLFATRVLVNGQEIKLSNPTGNGSITNGQYSVSGATGYPNKAYLNAYLRPGDNEVKVIFDSPLYEEVKGTSGERAFISDMYAHVVINTGQLTEGSLGQKSYYLDKLIYSPNRSATLLVDNLLKRFTTEAINNEVSVTQTITISAENAVQVSKKDCEVDLMSFSDYKGELFLNGVKAYEKEHFNRGEFLVNLNERVVNGKNTLAVTVKELQNNEPTSIGLEQICDLTNVIEASNLPKEFKEYSFGHPFNKVTRNIVTLDVKKAGKHTANFQYGE